jgi:hopanoid C-3 methylase
LFQAGFTILTPLPGTAYYEGMRSMVQSKPWAHFDMHHLLWEPALGPERFFELYCETWRRSVLNLRGRKSIWRWLREVDARNALFLLRALKRTQRMMSPEPYISEYRGHILNYGVLSMKGYTKHPNPRSDPKVIGS